MKTIEELLEEIEASAKHISELCDEIKADQVKTQAILKGIHDLI